MHRRVSAFAQPAVWVDASGAVEGVCDGDALCTGCVCHTNLSSGNVCILYTSPPCNDAKSVYDRWQT